MGVDRPHGCAVLGASPAVAGCSKSRPAVRPAAPPPTRQKAPAARPSVAPIAAAEALGLLLPGPATGSTASKAVPETVVATLPQAPARASRPGPLEALQAAASGTPAGVFEKGPPAAAAEEDNVSTTDDSEEASDEDVPSEPSPVASAAGQVRGAHQGQAAQDSDALSGVGPSKERHVHFDEEAHMVYEITPYSEIYGLHPRLFDFDKRYSLVPAKGQPKPAEILSRANDTEEDFSDSDDDRFEDTDWDEVWTLSTTPLRSVESKTEDAAMEHVGVSAGFIGLD